MASELTLRELFPTIGSERSFTRDQFAELPMDECGQLTGTVSNEDQLEMADSRFAVLIMPHGVASEIPPFKVTRVKKVELVEGEVKVVNQVALVSLAIKNDDSGHSLRDEFAGFKFETKRLEAPDADGRYLFQVTMTRA